MPLLFLDEDQAIADEALLPVRRGVLHLTVHERSDEPPP